MLKKYIGDWAFYRHVLTVAIPIIIQNAITNFVSLLDNIMVGQIGTLEMSGVSIANQLLFVFNLCIFGGISGAGIFTAQFYGDCDHAGIRQTFRFKFLLSLLLTAAGVAIFWWAGDPLIALFLQGEGSPEEIRQTKIRKVLAMDHKSLGQQVLKEFREFVEQANEQAVFDLLKH